MQKSFSKSMSMHYKFDPIAIQGISKVVALDISWKTMC